MSGLPRKAVVQRTSVDAANVPVVVIAAIRRTKRYGISAGSLRLNVGCADNFAPFLRFVGDELAEISRRACNCDAAEPY